MHLDQKIIRKEKINGGLQKYFIFLNLTIWYKKKHGIPTFIIFNFEESLESSFQVISD